MKEGYTGRQSINCSSRAKDARFASPYSPYSLQRIMSDSESDSDSISFPDFEKPWKKSDATLIVEDRVFHVHQSVLSVASPFFETLFADAKFAEGETKTATLKDKTASDVLDLLQVLYPPHKDLTGKCNYGNIIDMSSIDSPFIVDLIDKILPLADEFLMQGIKRACEKALLTRGAFDLKSIVLAENYKLSRLRKSAVGYVWRHLSFHQILDNDIFEKLDASTQSRILQERIRHVFARLPDDVGKLLSQCTKQDYDKRLVSIRSFTKRLAEHCDLGKNSDSPTTYSGYRCPTNYMPIIEHPCPW